MSYVALYRKWRPDTFDAVKGQDAIVRTLRNQIIHDRIGHAYLFCGTRGTGKTSIAKLFARAVNCENSQDGSPCNECPSCQAILTQSSLDVREIDAASNNGVDNIRELREEVLYPPTSGRYKVYIIDEVHMLSPGAFNALLKTLEEPPSYVIFILATTEKHKIPVTILSRCQKYDFRRISADTITDHLISLMEKENIPAEELALKYIARVADGSMRDALSLLDQCISFYMDQTITYENVLAVLGTVDTSVFSQLLRHILNQDTSGVLGVIDQSMAQGRDLSQFLSDFLWYLRNLLILKDQGGNEESLFMSTENITLLKEDARLAETGTLLRYINVLSDLSGQMRNSSQKRILMEVGFIRLCLPQMDTDTDSLQERLRILEDKIASGVIVAENTSKPAQAAPAKQPGPTGPVFKGNPEDLEKKFTRAQAEDLKAIASRWNDIITGTDPLMQRYLKRARPVVSEDSKIIRLVFNDDGLEKQYFELDHQEKLKLLSDIVADITGKRVDFECTTLKKTAAADADYFDLAMIQDKIKMEIIEE